MNSLASIFNTILFSPILSYVLTQSPHHSLKTPPSRPQLLWETLSVMLIFPYVIYVFILFLSPLIYMCESITFEGSSKQNLHFISLKWLNWKNNKMHTYPIFQCLCNTGKPLPLPVRSTHTEQKNGGNCTLAKMGSTKVGGIMIGIVRESGSKV